MPLVSSPDFSKSGDQLHESKTDSWPEKMGNTSLARLQPEQHAISSSMLVIPANNQTANVLLHAEQRWPVAEETLLGSL